MTREEKLAAAHLQVAWSNGKALNVDPEPFRVAADRLKAQVDEGRLPGFMSCVLKDGHLVHFSCYGLCDLAAGEPMKLDTLFRLYSQTKPITIVGLLLLLERGLLGLDDPIHKFIPGFANVTVGPKKKAPNRAPLVRDLLAHTSGVGFGPGFGNPPENDYERTYVDVVRRVDEGKVASLAAWCEEIAALPLRFEPGKDWGYGYSSDLLGRVIEVVSGRPLDEFLQAEVIDRLGMRDTHFAIPETKSDRLGALYAREPWDGGGKNGMKVKFVTCDAGGSGIAEDASKRVLRRSSDGIGPAAPSASVFLQGGQAGKVLQGGGCVCSVAGGLVSSMRDYARFGQMLLNEGQLDGVRVLRPETVQMIAKDWLNEFTTERRKQPLWVWNTPGIGFSPLGQIGVEHPDCKDRRSVGSQTHTVHWGGAGGSGYMLNWPHRVLVLTYTGCTYDTWTQKIFWRAAFGALYRGGAKPLDALPPCLDDGGKGEEEQALPLAAQTPSRKRRRESGERGRAVEDELARSPASTSTATPSPAKSLLRSPTTPTTPASVVATPKKARRLSVR